MSMIEKIGIKLPERSQFLTARWNNRLTLILGLPTLVYSILFLSTSFVSDFWGFIGIVILGVAY